MDRPGVFISYCKEDEPWLRQLVRHLSLLEADLWHDRELIAGERWAETLDKRLDTADIILMLISDHFLSPGFCRDIELPRALARERENQTVIMPIIVSACDWQNAPISRFQILPTNRKAIESWDKPNEAFLDVVDGIRLAIKKRAERRLVANLASAPTAGRTPPRRLLPYLCDRSEQEITLGEALQQHQRQDRNRPVVCLIHGDEQECHNEFLERLQYKIFPKYAKGMSVKEYEIRPSRALTGQKAFRAELGAALLDDVAASFDEIGRFIAGHEEPISISLHLLTEDFAENGVALLQSFLEFWREWPDLPPGRLVAVCVCLKYQKVGQPGFLDFKAKKLKRLNDETNDALHEFLKGLSFENDARLSGIVLPELHAIERGDVEHWSRVNGVTGLSEAAIRELFDRQRGLCNEDGHIPMEVLAEKLKTFVG